MRRSAHRLTQSVLATKVAVDNAAGTGRLPNLHIGLIFMLCRAIGTCIRSNVQHLYSIGRGAVGLTDATRLNQ
jgi:hypothetical protein